MERTINLYGTTVYGAEVSNYGLENGYLDYRTLAKLVGDCILNNTIHPATQHYDWELISGQDYVECGDEIVYLDIYQEYLISEQGYRFLERYTDEIVYYNEHLDVYIWGVTHYGTSWDYVLTNVKLVQVKGL